MKILDQKLIPDVAPDFETIMERETLTQVSLLQSLSQGDFLGSVTVGQLKQYGDTGIGTFDKLDGEMIVLDGTVYKARGDGSVCVASDDETVPFADVTFIDPDICFEVTEPHSMKEFVELLNQKVAFAGENLFYVATATCKLPYLKVRSAIPRISNEEAGSLADYMAHAEQVFEHYGISGHLVALYCPPYMGGLNLPGWHLHFLSDCKQIGGHVLDFTLDEASVIMDQTRSFNMILPDADHRFGNMDLTLDQSGDLAKVES